MNAGRVLHEQIAKREFDCVAKIGGQHFQIVETYLIGRHHKNQESIVSKMLIQKAYVQQLILMLDQTA